MDKREYTALKNKYEYSIYIQHVEHLYIEADSPEDADEMALERASELRDCKNVDFVMAVDRDFGGCERIAED